MRIEFKKKFQKSYRKLDVKRRRLFQEKLSVFIENPSDKNLRNHALTWDYIWYRSINISWDMRAIFRGSWNTEYEFIEFYDIGTYAKLYK